MSQSGNDQNALIRVCGVHKTFQLGDEPVHALNDIQLSINAGEYLSAMGPSGPCQSTVLNLRGRPDVPDKGECWLSGTDTVPLSEEQRAVYRRNEIGFVFQSYHLVPRLSAAENIELPLILAGIAPAERQRRLQPVLERLGLTDRAGHVPNQ